MAAQLLDALFVGKIDFTAVGKHRVNQPVVNAHQLGKALGDFFVGFVVVGFVAYRAAGVQRWQQVLLVQVFKNAGDAGRQIVVQQNRAGVKIFKT